MTRDEIIQKALVDKIGDSVTMFTSDEVLTVAGISDADIKTFVGKMNDEMNRLTQKDGNLNDRGGGAALGR